MQTTNHTEAGLRFVANANFSIDRREVQALLNRAKQLVLTQAWLGKPDSLRFAQGSFSALESLLHSECTSPWADHDSSLGGYQPLAGFEAAWAGLPVCSKNYSLAEVQEFLRLHAVKPPADAVTDTQVNSVEGLKDSEVAPIDLHDKHHAPRANVGDDSSLHTATPIVDPTILPPLPGHPWPAQGGTYIGIAPAEGNLPARHLVMLDIEPSTKLNWANAVQWAQTHGNGARLPTQLEALFAFTTAKAAFKPELHWTLTQNDRNFAFFQSFEHGPSHWSYKGSELRVRACRGLALQTFTPLTLEPAGATTPSGA